MLINPKDIKEHFKKYITKTVLPKRQAKGKPLANISLFMPDTLQVDYDSKYEGIDMTAVMGFKGYLGNAYQDLVANNNKSGADLVNAVVRSPYAKDWAAGKVSSSQ